MHRMGSHYRARAVLMAGTALAGALGLASHAAAAAAANEGATLAEVVVTAQKREQNLQDVPISVTAMTADTLEVNRITNVNDVREVEAEINGFNNARFGSRGKVVINGETRRGYKFTATEAAAEGVARVTGLNVHRIGVIGRDFIAVLPARG